MVTYYNMTCLYTSRDHDLCCDILFREQKTGWIGTTVIVSISLEHMKEDTDFDPVRDLEWYKELMSCLSTFGGEKDEK